MCEHRIAVVTVIRYVIMWV